MEEESGTARRYNGFRGTVHLHTEPVEETSIITPHRCSHRTSVLLRTHPLAKQRVCFLFRGFASGSRWSPFAPHERGSGAEFAADLVASCRQNNQQSIWTSRPCTNADEQQKFSPRSRPTSISRFGPHVSSNVFTRPLQGSSYDVFVDIYGNMDCEHAKQ